MLFAYVGPETILPLMSFLAGVVGVVMMLGRRAFAPVAKLYRLARPRSAQGSGDQEPSLGNSK